MKTIIQSILNAVDHIPSVDADINTHLKYQGNVLMPAIDLLRDLNGHIPVMEELEFVKAVVTDFIEEAKRQKEKLRKLPDPIGGNIRMLTIRGTDLDDDLFLATSFVRKLTKIMDKESVENVTKTF